VAIVEKRHEAVEIAGKTLNTFFTPDDLARRRTNYFAKPYESFCQENLSYMLKHLNETVWSSGINSLLNSTAIHNTFYKEASMILEKSSTPEGG